MKFRGRSIVQRVKLRINPVVLVGNLILHLFCVYTILKFFCLKKLQAKNYDFAKKKFNRIFNINSWYLSRLWIFLHEIPVRYSLDYSKRCKLNPMSSSFLQSTTWIFKLFWPRYWPPQLRIKKLCDEVLESNFNLHSIKL